MSLSKNINPSLVLVQPRKTSPFITEKMLIGRKESNKETNTQVYVYCLENKGNVSEIRLLSRSGMLDIEFIIMGARWLSGRVLD